MAALSRGKGKDTFPALREAPGNLLGRAKRKLALFSAVSQFSAWKRLLNFQRHSKNILSAEMLFRLGRKVWESRSPPAVSFPRRQQMQTPESVPVPRGLPLFRFPNYRSRNMRLQPCKGSHTQRSKSCSELLHSERRSRFIS